MTTLVFYEKKGCGGNAKQKALLASAGFTLVVHDLLNTDWQTDLSKLRSFFGEKKVADWFNRNAPAVKEGLVKPETFDEQRALQRLAKEPILIRRPLMEREDGARLCGFDTPEVEAWLGQSLSHTTDLETCAKTTTHCGKQP